MNWRLSVLHFFSQVCNNRLAIDRVKPMTKLATARARRITPMMGSDSNADDAPQATAAADDATINTIVRKSARIARKLLEAGPTRTHRPGRHVAQGAGPRVGSRVAPRRAGARHLKKSVGHFRPTRVADVYAAIDAIVHDDALPTASVCDVLGVSRSAYYAWRDGEPSGLRNARPR